jgi:chromosomal replication initiation ATPase DnaA
MTALSYEQQLKQRYADARRRIADGPLYVHLDQANKTIEDLENRLQQAENEITRLLSENSELILQRSDWQAVILYQAIRLCEMDTERSMLNDISLRVTAKEVIGDVLAEHPGYTVGDILSQRRDKRLTAVRQLCMYAVHKRRPDLSLPQIGKVFKRDHTTILHAIRKIESANGGDE